MQGDAGRCGEMQGDAGRCREMEGDAGRWRGDAGRCREMQGDRLLGGAQLVELAEEVAHRPRHLRAAQRAWEMSGDVGEM